MYHSDPGADKKKNKKKSLYQEKRPMNESEKFLGYYSEPDAKYIEIDYEFLKQLRKLAELNLKYRSKVSRSRREATGRYSSSGYRRTQNPVYEKLVYSRDNRHRRRDRSTSSHSSRDSRCDARCSVCQSQCILTSRSAVSTPTKVDNGRRKNRSRSIDWCSQLSGRRGSIHSAKSVSFIEDKELKSPKYVRRSFTNDLKVFQMKPNTSKFSFKEKFLVGLRSSFDDKEKNKKKPPSVGSVKELWKSF